MKRDEARAAAAEEAEEQRMQELDVKRRIQILRGEIPTPLAIEDSPSSSLKHPREPEDRDYGSGRDRKRRKKVGEDDTDFELRVARENQEVADKANGNQQIVLRKEVNTIVNHAGNIDLFPAPKPSSSRAEKNPEAEKEKERKKKEYEDQYTMKFSNAAGFKQGLEAPWYSKTGEKEEAGEEVGKDVWGNEDPRRKERQLQRVVSSDPLAMMKAGAKKVREVETERKKWREEKEREVRELEAEERRKRKRGHRDDDEDDLKGFRLDGNEKISERRKERHDDEERRHRHKESKRREHRDESRHRHRHRSRHHD